MRTERESEMIINSNSETHWLYYLCIVKVCVHYDAFMSRQMTTMHAEQQSVFN